jgi:indolepyruvate ferredoxin oxidoreductase
MDGDTLQTVTLDDKYTLERGRVFISGTQALVRLPIMQRQRDRAAGLNTAGFISGYRGSPLGGYDASLWQASHLLRANDIVFRPGINEDQAATAVWGTQQLDFLPGKKVDGVFAIWYGKGPGVDRSGDPLKHANFQGTHPNGGVLVVCGDDHPGKSSTLAHQSEQALAAHGIPVLYPAGPQDYLDYGLYGFAMSRFAGTLVGFKVVNETVTCTATVDVDPTRPEIVLPTSAPMPAGGVSARNEYAPPEQDARLVRFKLPRVQAFARENKLDRTTFGSEGKKRLGIVTAGKAYLDSLAALRLLGIGQKEADKLGIGVYKVAMVWPLEPENLKTFATSSDELLFVEEKRAVMEDQAKSILYGEAQRPRIFGKRDETGDALLPEDVQIEAATIAQAIAHRLEQLGSISEPSVVAAIASLRELLDMPQTAANMGVVRMPYFCSGCPHNTSTKLPDGSFAMAGIGCHGMAMLSDRNTLSGTHMGGEGVNWTGLAPFTNTAHVFQNLGDGTYYHSGILAIRAAVQAEVNITYKILYNDAVAMTGGQKHDGPLSVDKVVRQVLAEGVRQVAVVSDDPEKFDGQAAIPNTVKVFHRDDLDAVQRDMRAIEGTTVIVYEQTCAAEKRRRRKRNEYPDLPKRAFINPEVCEGCGDCSVQANCVSIHPLETAFGRKRQIDQSSCNKDYSCVKGFCPSFVTVYGGELRRPSGASFGDDLFSGMPAPAISESDGEYSVVVAGIGGTGVVTIAALLGMAAHLEGKGASVFDMTGLSQKNGAVYSHLWLLDDPSASAPAKVGLADADLILGCDLVAAAGADAMHAVKTGKTRAILNSTVVPTASFQTDRDMNIDGRMLERSISEKVGESRAHLVDASKFALKLLGNTIGANVFLIGFAVQKGCIPLTLDAIERAIELNGVSVDFNLRALKLGRLAAIDPARVESLLPGESRSDAVKPNTVDELIEHRRAALVDYQDEAYGARYTRVVETARRAETALVNGSDKFTAAVARNAYKVMAYKDEYAVAQMFTDGAFEKSLAETFEGDYKLRFHLAPPLLSQRDPATGEMRKSEYGPWVFRAFKVLAKLKGLRGTPLDIFGYTVERKQERVLRDDYLADVERLSASLTMDSLPTAVAIAEIPDQIRGYGHVKQKAMAKVRALREKLFAVVDQSSGMDKAA